MKIIESTCGTERMTECYVAYDEENNYYVNIEGIMFRKNQQVFGLGYYEEKALKNTLKLVDNKEIVKQIKEQFKI